jgi:hypothetical protein
MAKDRFISRDPDYSDLDLDFQINPITKDLNRKTGVDAIKRSIRNLIFTNYYEKPFRPFVGSDVTNLLFENVEPLTAIHMQNAIENLINNFEPRVRLKTVKVDMDLDNHGFNVRIEYIILNREQPVTSTIFLERIR